MVLRKLLAFIYKDIINQASYKFAFITQFLGIFFSALTLFYLSRLFGTAVLPYLKPYEGDYFSFVLIGVAFSRYLEVSLTSFSTSIRTSQMSGTLEAILVTQTQIPTIVFFSSVYNFVFTSFRVIIYLLFGSLVLGLDIGNANFMGALLVLFLTIICFSGFGIMSASFIMVLKKGDPFTWIFTSLSLLLGGVYYPIAVLPDWMQHVSHLLPITYSLEGMRLAMLKGCTFKALCPTLIPLAIFTLVILPVSIMVFKFAVKRAKMEGSLTHY